jgi:hypothetical protein
MGFCATSEGGFGLRKCNDLKDGDTADSVMLCVVIPDGRSGKHEAGVVSWG